MTFPDSGCPATGGAGATVVGFADGCTTCADGADAEGLGDAVRLGTLVVGALVVGGAEATGAGELATGEPGELVAAELASSLAAASDAAADEAAPPGVPTKDAADDDALACLDDVVHPASAVRATAAITRLVRPGARAGRDVPIRRGMPHADTRSAAGGVGAHA